MREAKRAVDTIPPPMSGKTTAKNGDQIPMREQEVSRSVRQGVPGMGQDSLNAEALEYDENRPPDHSSTNKSRRLMTVDVLDGWPHEEVHQGPLLSQTASSAGKEASSKFDQNRRWSEYTNVTHLPNLIPARRGP